MKIPLEIVKNRLEVATGFKSHKYRIGFSLIDFVVDTGCDVSCLSYADAVKTNFPLNTLKNPEPTYLGGNVWNSYEITDVQISFIDEKGLIEQIPLKKFHIILPTKKSREALDRAKQIPSIIGLDFLLENKLALYVNPVKNDHYLERL